MGMAEAKSFIFLGSTSEALTSFLFFRFVEGEALTLVSTTVRGRTDSANFRALEWPGVGLVVLGLGPPRLGLWPRRPAWSGPYSFFITQRSRSLARTRIGISNTGGSGLLGAMNLVKIAKHLNQ